MAKLCREIQERINESIEKPIEEYVKREEQRCREKVCNPWLLCLNKLFCWFITITVKVIKFVMVTIPKIITKIVCETIAFATVSWIPPLFCFFGHSSSRNVNLFSIRKALFFAKISNESYESPSDINLSTISNEFYDNPSNLEIISFISNTETIFINTQMYVIHNNQDNSLILSFKGSDEAIDWINDFTATQLPFLTDVAESNGLVHTGFYVAYSGIRKKLIDFVLNKIRDYNIEKISITGHSLGGGLATISALDLAIHISTDIEIEVYTYGAPRVGNLEFSNYYNDIVPNSFRIVNENDLATFVPPPSIPELNLHYRHINTLVFLDSTGNLNVDPCPKPGTKNIDELSKVFPIIGTPVTLINAIVQFIRQRSGFGDAHLMELYISNLEELNRSRLRNVT